MPMAMIEERARDYASKLCNVLVGESWGPSLTGATSDIYDPSDGSVITQVAECGREDVDAAVVVARETFASGIWSKMNPGVRARTLWKIGDLIDENIDQMSMLETIDTGKPFEIAKMVDVSFTAELFRYMAGAAARIEGATIPTAFASTFHAYTHREPVGVVGAIAPWNFPLLLAAMKLAPALAAGNVAILKPSEWTPLSSLYLADLAGQAGLPPGVLQVVTGDGATVGDAITRHSGINHVAFTGSTAIGRRVASAAGEALTPVTMELGGKSANIIFDDADLDVAIPGAAGAIFYNAGQNCLAGSRLFVHDSIYDQVVEGMVEAGSSLAIGPGSDPTTQLGPMVSTTHLERVLGYVATARSEGGDVLTGGNRVERDGYFVEPTVIAGLGDDDTAVREEIFGPVVSVLRFSDEEEAVARANASDFGLAAGLWTTDIGRTHRVAAALEAGNIYVNGWGAADPAVPFGGYKSSGWGRENGSTALAEFLQTKSIYVNIA